MVRTVLECMMNSERFPLLRARRASLVFSFVIGASLAAAPLRAGQAPQNAAAEGLSGDVQAMFVQGFNTTKVYMIVGAGATIAAQIGDDGVLLVDTGTASASAKVLAVIRQLT